LICKQLYLLKLKILTFQLNKDIYETIKKLQTYIPHYELVMPPVINDDVLVLSIKVKGSGDYLPEYAGNLDIINCAAIEISKTFI
jgi:acetaldehyde dehydrogenase